MNLIRSNLVHNPTTAMYHVDAKSKWFLPYFHQDIRGTTSQKTTVLEIGMKFLGKISDLWLTVNNQQPGFYDMRANNFLGLLLEESAGHQDGDMIGSLLYQFMTKMMAKDVKKLVLVLDNCG